MLLEELGFGLCALEEWRKKNYQKMSVNQRMRCWILCFGMKLLVYLLVWHSELRAKVHEYICTLKKLLK